MDVVRWREHLGRVNIKTTKKLVELAAYVKEGCFFVTCVLEGVWCIWRYDDLLELSEQLELRYEEETDNVTNFRIDTCAVFGMKADGAFRYVEGLVVLIDYL